VVLLRGLIQPLPAPVAAAANPAPGHVRALARLATWRDLGAALGPLAAGTLLPVVPAFALYGMTALLLAGAAVVMQRNSASRQHQWGCRRRFSHRPTTVINRKQ
jgi:hypothetical protein